MCGGTEAAINRVTQAGFAAARALSTGFAENPTQASRPFDQSRDGFVVGEGAGILVLESLEHALGRGAKPLAEFVGYGTSADAYHVTSGPEDGGGATRAMQIALKQAGILPNQIQHVNAHATSTLVGDAAELTAFRTVFGSKSTLEAGKISGPAITSTKSATGHLLGAAGAVEAIFSILALRDQVIPPTLNLINPDPLSSGMDIVRGHARKVEMEHALSNGFGFGGVNASVIFKRYVP